MAGNYVNNFNKHDSGCTTFYPDADHYDAGHLTFGNMLVGKTQLFNGPAVSAAAGAGINLAVQQNSADPTGPESRDIFVVNGNLFQQHFGVGQTLTAEIAFDNPDAPPLPVGANPKQYVWAVGLVLKDGNQDDAATDKKLGITCQFVNDGSINFNGTNYVNSSGTKQVANKAYDAYNSLRLRVDVSKIPNSVSGNPPVLSGTGAIEVDGTWFSGQLNIDSSIPSDWFTAAGVALVSLHNVQPSISVRLTQFKLSITP